MLRAKNAFALSCALLILPFSVTLADDEQTETLHNNSYQDFRAVPGCSDAECAIFFSATQHINTVVTAVSCSFELTQGVQILYAQLGSAYSGSNFNLPIVYTGSDVNNNSYLTTTMQVQLFIKQGDTPRFYIQTNGGNAFNLQCTISGYHS